MSPLKNSFAALISLLIISLMLFSCSSNRMNSRKSGDLYESFYSGEDGTQYFIKPITLESENGKMLVDFTFRSKGQDSVAVKFSLFEEEPRKDVKQMTFRTSNHQITADSVNLMFVELQKKYYKSRHTAHFKREDVKKIFSENSWLVLVDFDGEQEEYSTTNSTEKDIEALNRAVWQLID